MNTYTLQATAIQSDDGAHLFITVYATSRVASVPLRFVGNSPNAADLETLHKIDPEWTGAVPKLAQFYACQIVGFYPAACAMTADDLRGAIANRDISLRAAMALMPFTLHTVESHADRLAGGE